MTWNFTTTSIFYLLAGLINLIAAVMIWRVKINENKLGRLGNILFFTSGWLFFSFLELASTRADLRLRFVEIADVFNGLIDLSILLFVIDYFGYWPRFTKKWRIFIVGIAGIIMLLSATNSFHHLIWVDAVPVGLTEDNLYHYSAGPLFPISNGLYLSLVAISFLLMIHRGVTCPRDERTFTLLLAFSIALPFFFYLIYGLTAFLQFSTLGWALGYTLSAMFVTWIFFDRLKNQIVRQNIALDHKVQELKQELQNRRILENKLRKIQEKQTHLLDEQNQKLRGIYDLILLGNQLLPLENVREHALKKINELMGSDAICFYTLHDQIYMLDGSVGIAEDHQAALLAIKKSTLSIENETSIANQISDENEGATRNIFVEMGYQTVWVKRIFETNTEKGLLAALWSAPVNLSMAERTLLSGLGDGLNLILENIRLSQANITEAKFQERKRLARNLHDSVTQSLHSLSLTVETIIAGQDDEHPQMQKALALLMASAAQALKEMRLLLYEYNQEYCSRQNLLERVRERLKLVENRVGVDFELDHHPQFHVPAMLEEDLFNIVSEGLNNALKHSSASNVQVIFDHRGGQQVVEIIDNGSGFDQTRKDLVGLGIPSMRERCEQIGAVFELESCPDKGTVVKVCLPIYNMDP